MSTWRGHGGKLYVKSPQVELGIGKWTADESAVLANKTNSTSGGHKERQGTVRDTAISFEMPWDDTKDPDALGLHPGTSHALELQKGESGKKMTTTSFIIEKRSFVNDEDEDIVRLSVSGYSNAVMTHSMIKPVSPSQAAVAGSPGVLVIETDGGPHTFLVGKPSTNDLIAMQRWIHAHPLKELPGRGLSSDELAGLKPEEKLILLREYAKAKGQRREPTEGEVLDLVFSPGGVAMQVWLAARKHDRSLKREAIAELITEENYEQVSADLDAALGAEEGASDPKKPDGPDSSPPSSPDQSPTPS